MSSSDEADKAILLEALKGHSQTFEELRRGLGQFTPRIRAARLLEAMREEGLITQKLKGQYVVWELA